MLEASQEIDSLRRLLAESEAACAAMRTALEELTSWHTQPYLPYRRKFNRPITSESLGVAIEHAQLALAATAGRDMLAKLESLRKALIAVMAQHRAMASTPCECTACREARATLEDQHE